MLFRFVAALVRRPLWLAIAVIAAWWLWPSSKPETVAPRPQAGVLADGFVATDAAPTRLALIGIASLTEAQRGLLAVPPAELPGR